MDNTKYIAEVSNILKCDPRSVSKIVKDANLVNRILTEKPMNTVRYLAENPGISKNYLYESVRLGQISSFSNGARAKGSAVYIFPEEVAEHLGTYAYVPAFLFKHMQRVTLLNLKLVEKLLTPKEYEVAKHYFERRVYADSSLSELGHGYAYVSRIVRKVEQYMREYVDTMESLHYLNGLSAKLVAEVENLRVAKERYEAVASSFSQNTDNKYVVDMYTRNIRSLPLRPRTLNILQTIGIHTWAQVMEIDLDRFKKVQNVGAVTLEDVKAVKRYIDTYKCEQVHDKV